MIAELDRNVHFTLASELTLSFVQEPNTILKGIFM